MKSWLAGYPSMPRRAGLVVWADLSLMFAEYRRGNYEEAADRAQAELADKTRIEAVA